MTAALDFFLTSIIGMFTFMLFCVCVIGGQYAYIMYLQYKNQIKDLKKEIKNDNV